MTNGGPHTNARASPVAGSAAHVWRTSIITHSTACRTGTATNGAPNAAASPFQSLRLVTEQNDSSHSDTKTTDKGKGQYSQAVVKNCPKVLKVSSPIWSPVTAWLSPHRMAATRKPVAIIGRTTTACAHPCV